MKVAGFRKNIGLNVGASGVTFGLTLLTTPIMTRLFEPEAYGIYGILNNTAMIVVSVGLFGLPNALSQEHRLLRQRSILSAILSLTFLLSLLVVLLSSIIAALISSGINTLNMGLFVLFLPLLVCASALQRATNSLGISNGAFGALAGARVGSTLLSRALTLFWGWVISPAAPGMILGDVTSKLSEAWITIKLANLGRWFPGPTGLRNTKLLWNVITTYKDFALFSNLVGAIPLVVILCIQAGIGAAYSIEKTGYFVLASSILGLPISLLSMATAPVIFHRFVKTRDTDHTAVLGLSIKVFVGYVLVGGIILLPVLFFGPWLFAFFLGAQWEEAGRIAALLYAPKVLLFSLNPLQSVYHVTRRFKMWCAIECLSTLPLFSMFFLVDSTTPLQDTIYILAIFMTLQQLVLHAGVFYTAYSYSKGKAAP